MTALKYLDTPISWAVVGFVIGLAFGVNAISVWLLVAGLVAFLLYLRLAHRGKPFLLTDDGLQSHDAETEFSEAELDSGLPVYLPEDEGRHFSAGPIFVFAWIIGFVVHGLVF